MMVRLQLRASVFCQGYQIRTPIKIRDFEAQEFRLPPGASGGPDLSQTAQMAGAHNISQRVLM
jgi:hypothetical protein